MNLYLTRPGRLSRKDNTLFFEIFNIEDENLLALDEETPLDEDNAIVKKHALPVESIDAVYVFSETRINSKLLNFLAQMKIPVHFFNYYGYHSGTFMPNAEQLSGELVVRQGLAFADNSQRTEICRAITDAKLHNILSILQYYGRRVSGTEDAVSRIDIMKESLKTAGNPEEIMGIEGMSNRTYYDTWKLWMKEAEEFTRNYNPPDTPLNAIISFINSLLYTACVSEIYRTALYPGISYIHAPQTKRFSLALDLVEPFKPIMVDRLIFRLFDRKEISDKDFRVHSNGILLADDARKKILQEWDTLLRTTVQIPQLKRSVSYRQLIRLDCYKLAKHLLENKEFKPYKVQY